MLQRPPSARNLNPKGSESEPEGLTKAARRREQQKRHRAREAANRVWVGTEFEPQETATLCRLNYLSECELENPQRIAEALHALLANIREP